MMLDRLLRMVNELLPYGVQVLASHPISRTYKTASLCRPTKSLVQEKLQQSASRQHGIDLHVQAILERIELGQQLRIS